MRILLAAALLLTPLPLLAQAVGQPSIDWRFDNLVKIGGVPATVVGSPTVIDSSIGKAVHFVGHGNAGDALFFPGIPLQGATAYTWEVIFRPASGGQEAQRFFHLQQMGSENRRLFEIRIMGDKWCLDSFAGAGAIANAPPEPSGHATRATLLVCDAAHLFPLDRWYAVAAVYDGHVLRNYVDGVMQAEAPAELQPLGEGGVSVGARYNKVYFFSGDVFAARFTRAALPVEKLMKVPAAKP